MLKFVPSEDLSEIAEDATSIISLDFGYIQVGDISTQSIRIGNSNDEILNYSLAPETFGDWIDVSPSSGSLNPDYISDTTIIEIAPPLELETEMHSVDLIAATDEREYRLELSFTVVGANELRMCQYPERRTDFTDNVSGVINRVSESFRLHRFDPIAYNPADKRIFFDSNLSRNLTGDAGSHRWITQNFAERLNPLNDEWGYVRSDETILASFHEEDIDVEISFTRNNSMMNYTSTAFLVVPAEFELPRLWALFSPANDPDPAQYKRTVFLIRRQGDFWCLHNIYARYRGNELSHYEIELVQLHRPTMGSEASFNPFAFTYEMETDKPYAVFPVDYGPLFESILNDSSGSNASNVDVSGSQSPEPEEPLAPLPVSAVIGEVGSIWRAIVTFDSELAPATLATSNWRIYTGEDSYYPATAVASENVVTLETSLASFNIPSALPPQVTYSAETPDLFGANGVAVEEFQILE